MKEHTLAEMRKAKEELEGNFRSRLNDFAREYGVTIERVDVQTVDLGRDSFHFESLDRYVESVTIDVNL